MEEKISLSENLKQKSGEAGKGLLEAALAVVGLSIFFLYRFFRNVLGGVFGFIIGAIGLYIYLGIIGVILLYALDAILHGISGH